MTDAKYLMMNKNTLSILIFCVVAIYILWAVNINKTGVKTRIPILNIEGDIKTNELSSKEGDSEKDDLPELRHQLNDR